MASKRYQTAHRNKNSMSTYHSLLQLDDDEIENCRRYAKKEFNQLAKDHLLRYNTKEVNLKTAADEKYIGRNSVFGLKLDQLLVLDKKNRARSDTSEVPVVVQMLFNILDWHGYKHDGILRISPSMKVANEIKEMCASDYYNFRDDIEKNLYQEPVHVTTHMLKLFIRLLPGTIFTKQFADAFAHLSDIDDMGARLLAMKMLVFQLPKVNAIVLHKLLHTLQSIAENEEHNRMSVDAIARIMTMSLFKVGADVVVPKDESLDKKPPFNVMLNLIEHREYLFMVPRAFMARLNEKDMAKEDDSKRTRTRARKVKGMVKKTMTRLPRTIKFL